MDRKLLLIGLYMLVPDESDTWQTAMNFCRDHGERAIAEVDRRIAELRQFNRLDALTWWIEIRRAVVEILDLDERDPD